jgi:ABC-2 type transport system permease protein
MRKLWLIAKHEYLKRVRQRSFILLVLGLPLFMVLIGAISIVAVLSTLDRRPVGFIDRAALISEDVLVEVQAENNVQTPPRRFADEASARSALEAEEIQAYYVIPEGYPSEAGLDLYYESEPPDDEIQDDFGEFLRAALIRQQPEEVQDRLAQDIDLSVHAAEGERTFDSTSPLDILIPFFGTFLIYFSITMGGGYMLQAITEEKENRTMEIMASSVTPQQLMIGKAVGLMGVVVTQMLLWGGPLLVGGLILGRFIQLFVGFTLPWTALLLMVVYFIPTFALVTAFMIAVGAVVPDQQQGQQLASIFNLLFMMPVFFSAVILSNPQHPIVVGLSLFPTTAFITVLMRWALSGVPTWQLIVSWLILTGTSGGMLWVASRIFRMGMLRYGQRLKFKGVLSAIRGVRPQQAEEGQHA